MILKLYEFLLIRFIGNMKIFNLICNTFPKLNKKYNDRIDEEIAKVEIPTEVADKITIRVWKNICKQIREEYKKDLILF